MLPSNAVGKLLFTSQPQMSSEEVRDDL